MKQVLAGLATRGQTAGIVSTRLQSALYRFANVQIFLLDALADIYARAIALSR